MTTSLVSAKAQRLHREGKVRIAGTATVVYVEGDSATYRVLVGDDWASCPCRANRELCSHSEVAILAVAERDAAERAAALAEKRAFRC